MKRNRAVRGRFSLSMMLAVALSTGSLWLAIRLHAQQQQPSPTRQEPSRSKGEKEPQADLRVNVRLVNVFTTVTDSNGAPIANLQKEDFKVIEDGIPQDIRVFDRESALPLSIIMEVDTSPSTERDFKLEIVSAKRFAKQILRPVDKLAVFQVTEHIDQVAPFTSDLHRIDRGIDSLRVGPGTSIYDAIFLGSEALMDREGRKVLVLITDGGDTTSKADYQAALRRAQQSEAIVYSIIVVPVEADAGRNLGGEHALIQISKDTGGKYYYAEGIKELDSAFQQISEELRTQYLIAYYPNRQVADAPFRKIKVEVARKDPSGKAYQVRHRAGYYTAPPK